MANLIVLSREPGASCWLAHHADPRIAELFGTPVLPTAYTTDAPALTVYQAIGRLNPAAEVRLYAVGLTPDERRDMRALYGDSAIAWREVR